MVPRGDITNRQSRAGEAPAAHSRIHVEKEVYAETPATGRMFESPPPKSHVETLIPSGWYVGMGPLGGHEVMEAGSS